MTQIVVRMIVRFKIEASRSRVLDDWVFGVGPLTGVVVKMLHYKVVFSNILAIAASRGQLAVNPFRGPISRVELQTFEIVDGKSACVDLKLVTHVWVWWFACGLHEWYLPRSIVIFQLFVGVMIVYCNERSNRNEQQKQNKQQKKILKGTWLILF